VTLGVILGFSLGLLLYNTAFFFTNNVYLMVGLALLGAILLGYFALSYSKHIVIYGTSFIGSYIFIRGISLFAGKYPSEIVVYGQLSHGIKPEFEWQFYAYLAAIIVIFILGSQVQVRTLVAEEKEEDPASYQEMESHKD
jgi:hypothetical protein